MVSTNPSASRKTSTFPTFLTLMSRCYHAGNYSLLSSGRRRVSRLSLLRISLCFLVTLTLFARQAPQAQRPPRPPRPALPQESGVNDPLPPSAALPLRKGRMLSLKPHGLPSDSP